MKKHVLIILAVFVVLVLAMSAYSVDNTKMIIIARLGKPVRVVTEPGLHLKIPFMETTVSISKRVMHYTSQTSSAITKDKKTIMIDNYCVWKVSYRLLSYWVAVSPLPCAYVV